ncbi:MAG: SpoIID/LytB domain-containing protein [Candidatus Zixiibacteriota bacterium]
MTLRRTIQVAARFGTGILLVVLVYSCATVPGLKEESSGTYIRVPFVRVLLGELESEAVLSADGSFSIECIANGKQDVFFASQPIEVTSDTRHLRIYNHKGTEIMAGLDEVNVIPRGAGNRVRYSKGKWRGIIKCLPKEGNVQLINIVYMEDYLRGVVPPELGKRSEEEIEAVKAQAVAARTYAIAHLEQYGDKPYDVKSSIIDQVYNGASAENKLTNHAIDATAGDVITFEEKFINAYYHSTCGGMTDDISHVWDRKESPYLRAVADSGACRWSKYYVWREHFTEPQLRGRIEQYLSSDRGRDLKIDTIQDLIIKERTPGGRISKLLVRTDNDVYRFQRDRIRWVIGRTSNPDLILPSDRFDVEIKRDRQGSISMITFQGRGYGHGVGMCQCGAIGLARKGWEFDDILTHYYSGVEVKKLY